MSYSLFFQNDTANQIAIPTGKIEKLILGNGEMIIGPGVPNRDYYKYIDQLDAFPSNTPDSVKFNPVAPGTRSVMARRAQMTPEDPEVSEADEVVQDIDGNTYRTIRIGSQTWMAENLRVTRYEDGTPIPLLTNGDEWTAAETGAMSLYDGTDNYGMLYNWYAMNDPRKLAPEGWHIPTDAEWMALESALGMPSYETDLSGTFRGEGIGGKLSGENQRWDRGALALDRQFAETAFKALPSGYRGYLNGSFSGWGSAAFFWTATTAERGSAWYRSLSYNHSGIYRDRASKQVGFAVRCIKDHEGYEEPDELASDTPDPFYNYSPNIVSRIDDAEIWRGMTTDMARLRLGEPERINRTEYDFTIYERWVYPDGKVLFFRSAVLQSWDDEEF